MSIIVGAEEAVVIIVLVVKEEKDLLELYVHCLTLVQVL